jgi:hypothetical protein
MYNCIDLVIKTYTALTIWAKHPIVTKRANKPKKHVKKGVGKKLNFK